MEVKLRKAGEYKRSAGKGSMWRHYTNKKQEQRKKQSLAHWAVFSYACASSALPTKVWASPEVLGDM